MAFKAQAFRTFGKLTFGFRTFGKLTLAGVIGASLVAGDVGAQQKTPSPGSAKAIFGAEKLPTQGPAQPIGFYAKGCMTGAEALPVDGPTWQAMRLSRNRRWGNPAMISLLEKFSQDARTRIGWPGILVGDIAQPRGGPMPNGHASHQIGLDADVWLTPMPSHRMSYEEREDLPFISMLQKDKFLTLDPKVWSEQRAELLMLAASYPQVQRIFVNPAIKKKLCDTWTGDRTNLGKLRPEYGHDSHFHIRIKCPPGANGCTPQPPVAAGDGCDKSLAWWFTKEPWAAPKPSTKPPKPPREVMVSDLPKACSAVVDAPSIASTEAGTYGGPSAASALTAAPAAAPPVDTGSALPSLGPVPNDKPVVQ
ncbi:penicillin-insensitive murein endopeptidase [Rhizobium sp. BK196]|uniref:penicillin-insensitive murein endopeptidase n=1 Tax=unclassified Rhizobium TaxID=2613769 RepID=UPI001617A4E4|nr:MULTISPECIES: penicillin-insensitive murein endopeptidase [unclassified Rhizobium]MBB3311469.1 penicillin-insensitive murein endopeptidase [Rhizobium sp. BK196]MBB3460999.1 penicillin-insensitive murein endopeptidase [Rhizobium sp. BK377]